MLYNGYSLAKRGSAPKIRGRYGQRFAFRGSIYWALKLISFTINIHLPGETARRHKG